ncbi:thioredoxin family protein [Cellulosilyticum sp. I15G10I2]|uniref:thioredoxin family protein n=1 Tax=Cellulosilyticum sp. I15G10I2 TaxID=1892843 RepID=UPI00085BCC91|nr:thioredoxin family protein [Cellulosilyticum sp. I15G10I2]
MQYIDEKRSLTEKFLGTASTLLGESTIKLLKIIFSNLEREITLATIVDSENPKSIELKNYIRSIASLSRYIHTETYNKDENPDAEVFFHADKFPVVSLIDDENYYMGVKFHGLPVGDTLTAFILAIYYLAGPREELDPSLAQKIIAIDRPVDLKVCVSSTGSSYSDTVVSAQRLALLNPNVQAEMIDIDLFPALKKHYGIKQVPALIINDETIYFGPKTLDEILDYIL